LKGNKTAAHNRLANRRFVSISKELFLLCLLYFESLRQYVSLPYRPGGKKRIFSARSILFEIDQ